jgi:kinesin family member C2/C3
MMDLEAGLSEEQKAAIKSTGRTTAPKVVEFDHVFGENSTQEEVFAKACPLVTSVMDGWHASILAYGQTGSGKTYTMEGVPGNEGVNVRALTELFSIKEEKEASGIENVEVSLTMVEIYNEQVRDLLSDSSAADSSCEIRQRPAIEGGGVFLPTATVVRVNCVSDVHEAMSKGKANRSTGSTKANEHSSRSHSVLMVDVKVTNIATGLVSSGRLSLVDLAGSERIAKTGATGSTLKEAQAINKSLSALGNVISSLKAKQQNEKAAGHVPYRDSRLTFLLQV